MRSAMLSAMRPRPAPDPFVADLATFDRFGRISDETLYRPLPDDWVLGLADVVRSTGAIESGGYKAVNMAGAAVIAAMSNAIGGRDFLFVFGGDGASFAAAPGDRDAAEKALADTAAWTRDALGLVLRIALVPVAAIRAAGHDVRAARFAASPDIAYAMFAGGGLAWAEARMKEGAFALAPGPAGALPDLTGLTCRFDETPASRGVVLSLIVVRPPGGDPVRYRGVLDDLLRLIDDSPDSGRPLPEAGPTLRWPAAGLALESRAAGGSRLGLLARSLFALLVLKTGLPVGRFRPRTYRRQLVDNSDYRKFDDGLRMTIDASKSLADAIEQRLAAAAAAGTAAYGLHRQEAALVTCITPSVYDSDHIHFVDGAAGGYAAAASALKASLSGPAARGAGG
jgi:hypothetical protein